MLHIVSWPSPLKCTRKRGLVTLCTTSCPKLKNVARPIRSVHLQSNRYSYIFVYYKHNMHLFSLELVPHQHRISTDLLEKCVRQRRKNDPKDWWQAKIEQFWTQKADGSFKFKLETARTLKIYFERVGDRGNETIVETITIVKQVILASKSRL